MSPTRKSSSKRTSSRSGVKRASAKKSGRKSAAKRQTRRSSTRSAGAASPNNPSPGISRIDQPSRRTHGYFVRVGYRMTDVGSRPTSSAYFGDASHGGRRKAWEAAEAWLRKARRAAGK